MNVRDPKFSIWAATCIAIGLVLAYIDGVDFDGLIFSALLMSSLIFSFIAITWLCDRLKRRRPSNK